MVFSNVFWACNYECFLSFCCILSLKEWCL
jgi:hypothetical protein